jgi:TPR repeat protein
MKKLILILSLSLYYCSITFADDSTVLNFEIEYQKATEQSDPEAQYQIGIMFANGKIDGTRVFKGIEHGEVDNKQQNIEPDYIHAKEWFEKAANQGHLGAQHSLAILYYNGQGTKQNYQKGIQWDTKAANKGYPIAQYTLATMYHKGTGVKQNYAKAKQWYAKAAAQNYLDSKEHLAVVSQKVQAIIKKNNQAKKQQASSTDCGCD